MNYWPRLTQTVETTLKTERIGQLVFVKCILVLTAEVTDIHHMAAGIADYISGWLAASLGRVYVLEAGPQRQLTLSLEYPTGASALLSLSTARVNSALDLSLFGNAGAIYHTEAGPFGLDEAPQIQTSPQLQAITEAIRASVETGQPIDLPRMGGRS